MGVPVIRGDLAGGCPVKDHPDQANNRPADERVDNHGDEGRDLKNMILKSRVCHYISKRPKEHVAQPIHKHSKPVSRVCSDQQEKHPNADQRLQTTEKQPNELSDSVKRLPIFQVNVSDNPFFMDMIAALLNHNSFAAANLVSI